MRDPAFANVFPNVTLAEDSQAAGRWNTNAGGGYLAAGVGAGITGRGAHLFIVDDPFKGRAEADSERERAMVWSWYDSEVKTRLAPGGAIIIVNTRWHEEDLTGMVLKHHADENWVTLKLPAIANEGTKDEQALWPERFDLEYLRSLRASYMKSHPREWHALYQQSPRAEQGTYIQRGWFDERYEKASEPLNVYMASDFAVAEPEEGKEPDFTEHGVFGMAPDDKVYVLDWWYGQTTSDVWIESLIDLFAKWKPVAWFGEGGVIRHAIKPFLERRMLERKTYTQVEWLNPIHDKATSGRAFQARAAMGRIVLPSGKDWAERILNQWVGFPGASKDDAFDTIGKMCRAIDEAHPAIAAPSKKDRPKDDWAKSFKPAARARSYKVV